MDIIVRYWWFLIPAVSVIAYFPVIDNFFGWDDFLWLYRAKTLLSDPYRILQIDTFYFDPLVHISFWLNFKLFGLDYRWYHITDIAIHAVNGLLLFRFVKLYSGDDALALFSGLIFATVFSVSDAVLWPSSRVDLLAAPFSLLTLILFLKYIRGNKSSFYIASIAAYVTALSVKGTPLVIPVFLIWLYIREAREHPRRYTIFIPFVVISVVYFILLRSAMASRGLLSKGLFHLNLYNYSLSLASFIIPEMVLSKLNLTYVFFSIYGILLVSGLIRFSPDMDKIKSTGLFIMLLFLVPVLMLGDFILASEGSPEYYLLASPSHRIYLASIGLSIFMAATIAGIFRNLSAGRQVWALPLAVLLFVTFNVYEIWEKEKAWSSATREMKDCLYGLKRVRSVIKEGSTVGLVNFSMSEGFLWPMLKVYYDLKDVTVLALNSVPAELPDAPVYLNNDYVLLVRGRNGVYDFSGSFREMLMEAFKYQNSRVLAEREGYRAEYKRLATELNQRILVSLRN